MSTIFLCVFAPFARGNLHSQAPLTDDDPASNPFIPIKSYLAQSTQRRKVFRTKKYPSFCEILSKAANNSPFLNSLGMKFVPVEIAGGPSAGQQVRFSIWMTRVQDYRKYAEAQSEVAGKSKNSGGGFQSLMNLFGF